MITYIKAKIIVLLFYIFRIFPIKKNKIVFSSYAGQAYGGEGKCIYEAMGEEKNLYDIVWICRNTSLKAPKDIRLVPYLSLKSIYEQITAHVWIDNRRKASYVRKRKNQYYIQTWHGGGPCLKWVEKDAQVTLSPNYVKSATRDSQMANVLVSGSEWRTRNMLQSFWYDGEIVKCDLYKKYNGDMDLGILKNEVMNYFGIDIETKLFLYAPTFRKDGNLECYEMDYAKVIKTLSIKYGGTWKVIVRLHPHITKLHSNLKYSEFILNGSLYPQIENLILASEFLVTDYSGCMFNGFKLKRKVLLYALDLEHYLKEERGMYFDIKRTPAPFADSMDRLINNIINFDDLKYEQDRKEFIKNIGYYESTGPELVAERIKNVMLGRKS